MILLIMLFFMFHIKNVNRVIGAGPGSCIMMIQYVPSSVVTVWTMLHVIPHLVSALVISVSPAGCHLTVITVSDTMWQYLNYEYLLIISGIKMAKNYPPMTMKWLILKGQRFRAIIKMKYYKITYVGI